MTFLPFLAAVAIAIVILGIVFLFCFGIMHAYLKDTNQSFGSQMNAETKQRFRDLERKLDAALAAKH